MTSGADDCEIDYDVYDAGSLSQQGSKGSYFQRVAASHRDVESWHAARQAVLAGKFDETPAYAKAAVAIGALKLRGSVWFYRFRSGLRDSFGRQGRVVFVIVRCVGAQAWEEPRVGRLLGATDDLGGLPLNLTPLVTAAMRDGPPSAAASQITKWLARHGGDVARLTEGDHVGYTLDEPSGSAHATSLVAASAFPSKVRRMATQRTEPQAASRSLPPHARLQPRSPVIEASRNGVRRRRWRNGLVVAVLVSVGVALGTRVDVLEIEVVNAGTTSRHACVAVRLWRIRDDQHGSSTQERQPGVLHGNTSGAGGGDTYSQRSAHDPE